MVPECWHLSPSPSAKHLQQPSLRPQLQAAAPTQRHFVGAETHTCVILYPRRVLHNSLSAGSVALGISVARQAISARTMSIEISRQTHEEYKEVFMYFSEEARTEGDKAKIGSDEFTTVSGTTLSIFK